MTTTDKDSWPWTPSPQLEAEVLEFAAPALTSEGEHEARKTGMAGDLEAGGVEQRALAGKLIDEGRG